MTQVRTTVFSDLRAAAGGSASSRSRADLTGCPWHDVKAMLRQVGLRPTRQRMALGWILFAKGDRHLTAEMLYEEATKAKVPVSLATVYNTLHHFIVEGDNALVDIPGAEEIVSKMPVAPAGYEIARIDVVVRLRKKGK